MTIRARYPGRCAKCGQAIQPGDEINWDKRTKRTEHVTCEAALRVQAAKARLKEIKRDIQQRGEKPEASDGNARGERMFNTQTAYGGGDWFVVNDTEIWYVRNNGMDGDCWSANNVTTGGAGAIGRRIPRDETLVAELRELAEIVK